MADRSFSGSIVALVTPWRDGRLDETATANLIERQLAAGTHGIVLGGTTGESPTLEPEEFARLLVLAREIVRGRIPLIAGTGTNCTHHSVAKTRRAAELGADAALVVTPYYNKPTPAGLVAHYAEVAREGGLPVIAYSVPGRTGVRPDLATWLQICRLPGVVGLKEASDDLTLAAELAAAVGDECSLLSGEDGSSLAFWAMGGQGTISVTANVDPWRCREAWERFAQGDLPGARRVHHLLLPLHRALFWETNPGPVKWALHQLGLCSGEVRLPLSPLAERHREPLAEVLRGLDLQS
ncbi:MAG: 4-hydroxy-tetrahydrodipicolinate synthase [Myxococcota bacterium]|jgi:4-hydroxy-tetrahydrodipicolinate synthase|nr:4-hydroxy-tetrahydrodipicolinate synthase [Myxococcota bacterium]